MERKKNREREREREEGDNDARFNEIIVALDPSSINGKGGGLFSADFEDNGKGTNGEKKVLAGFRGKPALAGPVAGLSA